MSDDPAEATGEPATGEPRSAGPTGRGADVETVVTYLQWGALVALGLLALVAVAGVYTSVAELIEVWVAARYRPLASAAFNLAVLCAATAGIVALLRRVRG